MMGFLEFSTMANAVTLQVPSKVNSLPYLPPRDYCQNGPGPRLGRVSQD